MFLHVAATGLEFIDPSNTSLLTYTTTSATNFTFQVTVVSSDGGSNVTDIKLYVTTVDDLANITDVQLEFEISGDKTINAGESVSSNLTTSVQLDRTNCYEYTHICVLLITAVGTPDNNDVCVTFGSSSEQAGLKECPKPSSGGLAPWLIGVIVIASFFGGALLCMMICSPGD
ncbi:uncharacterized protein LOC144450015 [Glandiceps talaboti]